MLTGQFIAVIHSHEKSVALGAAAGAWGRRDCSLEGRLWQLKKGQCAKAISVSNYFSDLFGAKSATESRSSHPARELELAGSQRWRF